MAWRKGDLLEHRVNVDLGPGRVEELEGRRIRVFFPRSGTHLVFNASDAALAQLTLGPGDAARLEPGGSG